MLLISEVLDKTRKDNDKKNYYSQEDIQEIYLYINYLFLCDDPFTSQNTRILPAGLFRKSTRLLNKNSRDNG